MTTSLRRSYERFHSVTDSARDAIVSTDPDGRITFWNRSAQTIFGCLEKDALGRSLTTFVAEDDRRVYLETVAPLLAERFSEDELRQIIAILESPVKRKFEDMIPEMQKTLGSESDGTTNRSQPVRSNTNQPSAAPGSGR